MIVSSDCRCRGWCANVALVVRSGVSEQQAAHADHAVHRRADLVAHRREEAALGLVGGLGLLARVLRSWNSRAFWIAITAWSVKVLSSATSLVAEALGGSRATWACRCRGLPTASGHEHRGRPSGCAARRSVSGPAGCSASPKYSALRCSNARAIGDRARGLRKVARSWCEHVAGVVAVAVATICTWSSSSREDRHAFERRDALATVHDALEHRRGVLDRTADDASTSADGVAPAPRGSVEQARVLHRDRGLVGEGLEQAALVVGERPHVGVPARRSCRDPSPATIAAVSIEALRPSWPTAGPRELSRTPSPWARSGK